MASAATPSDLGSGWWMDIWDAIKSHPKQLPTTTTTTTTGTNTAISYPLVYPLRNEGPGETSGGDSDIDKACSFWSAPRPDRGMANEKENQKRKEEREAKKEETEKKTKRQKRPHKKNRRKRRLPRNKRRAKRRAARTNGDHRGRFCRPKQMKRQQRRYKKRELNHTHRPKDEVHWEQPQQPDPQQQPPAQEPNMSKSRFKRDYVVRKTKEQFEERLQSFQSLAQQNAPGENVLDAVVDLKPREEDDSNRTKVKSKRFKQHSKERTKSRINFSVKMKLRSAISQGKDQAEVNKISTGLEKLAHLMHQPSIEASRIALSYILPILQDDNKSLPSLDLNFWRKIYEAAHIGLGFSPGAEWTKLPGFVDFFRDTYCKLRTDCGLPHFSEDLNTASIREHLAKQFYHNCQTHVIDLLPVIVDRYAFRWLKNKMDSDSPHWKCFERHEKCSELCQRITSFFVRKLCWATNHDVEDTILLGIFNDIGPWDDEGVIRMDNEILTDVLKHIGALMNRYYTTGQKDDHSIRYYFLHYDGSPHMNNYWKYLPLIHDLQDAMDIFVTEPKQIKILPQSSLEVKDIRINLSTMHEIQYHVENLKNAGKKLSTKDYDAYKNLLYYYFPGAISYERDVDKGDREFLGCTTDGISVSLQFGRHLKDGEVDEEAEEQQQEEGKAEGDPPSEEQQQQQEEGEVEEDPPPKELSSDPPSDPEPPHFSYTRRDAIGEDYVPIFLDPGERDILTCSTLNGEDKWRLSERQFQHIRGSKMLAARAERMMEKFKKDEGVDLKEIPSGKTIKVNELTKHLQFVFTNMKKILGFYQQHKPKNQKFTRYIKRQEGLNAMQDCVYNHGNLGQTPNSKKVVVFGDAVFYNSIGRKRGKGRIMAPFQKFKNRLHRMQSQPEKHGGVHFLDEYGTSKYCCGCHEELSDVKKPVENSDTEKKIHALKICENPHCFHKMLNRDTNAVMNFQFLYFRVVVFGLGREAPFVHT